MKKRIITWLLAMVMLMSTAVPVFALDPTEDVYDKSADAVTQTVTLHKLLMTKDELGKWNADGPKGYDGSQDLAGLQGLVGTTQTLKEIAGVYFRWKFADDEVNGANKGKYVKVDAEGNVTATDNAEEAYGGLTKENGIVFNTSKFKGKFVIEEVKEKSTYKGDKNESLTDSKAVPVEITLPLVAEQGTVVNAHVYPKNTQEKPQIDKNFSKEWVKSGKDLKVIKDQLTDKGAVYENYDKEKAQVSSRIGEEVPYEVKTKVPAKSDYEHMVWSDTMTHGLTYQKGSLKIVATGITLEDKDYTLTQNESGFTLTLNKSGLDKIKASEKDVEFTLTYKAVINSSAVVDSPDKNEVRLDYGHKPKKDHTPKPVNPSNQEIKVTKTWADGAAPAGVKVQYFLWEGNPKSDANAKVVDQSPVLTENPFNYTFKNLDNKKTYYVEEHVIGYTPEYTVSGNTVSVTNTKDNDNPPPLVPTTPEVVTGGKKFVKQDATTKDRLAGAKFLVKTSDGTKYLYKKSDAQKAQEYNTYKQKEADYQTAINNYNNRKDDTNKATLLKAIEDARIERDKAFKASQAVYEWKDAPTDKNPDNLKDTDIVILTSDNQGRFEITGLTYGSYKLEEIQPPKGYAARSDVDFTIGKDSYTTADVDIKYTPEDAANNAKAVDNKKTSIPQTGGIGTIIFTVAGLAIMTTAVLSLKRKRKEEM